MVTNILRTACFLAMLLGMAASPAEPETTGKCGRATTAGPGPELLNQQDPDTTARAGSHELKLKDLFFEPFLQGVRPEFTGFSADMKRIFFSWNDSSYSAAGTYQVELDGSHPQKVPEDTVHRFQVSPDRSAVAYATGGTLYLSDTEFNNEMRLADFNSGISDPVWSPDGSMISFITDGEIWIAGTEESFLKQVTAVKGKVPVFEFDHWAGNNKLILSSRDFSGGYTVYFPEYQDILTPPAPEQRGIPEITVAVADLGTGAIDTLFHGRNRSDTDVSVSGQYLAADYADGALKKREIRVYDLKDGDMTVVFEDSTEGWLHGRYIEFNPEQDILMFQSERDNWNHIYTVKPDGTGLKQHTSGEYDIPWAGWHTSSSIVYASSEEDPGERHIYTLDTSNGHRRKLTETEAYRSQFRLSPGNRYLIYAKTYFNRPHDLFLLDLQQPGREVMLTHSIPDAFWDIQWQKEEYIRFSARDGQTTLSMSVLFPPGCDKDRDYPVVVFLHGAGSLQNVYKGWSENYHREYMFNQFLASRGYVVAEVDFRHSTGYGRRFREDVTNWLGRYETMDIIDGLDWLEEHTGITDPDRVGVYGG
ncbi:MAG: DPP IV N-terminal domain-containing protein, partial [Balneolaceae bacterium]